MSDSAATVDLSVDMGGWRAPNPVGTASGTFGKGLEFQGFFEVARLGFVVVKTITTEARAGNPPPRLCETPGGLMNSIGLPNPGAKRYVAEVLPRLRELGAPLVINVAGHDIEDFGQIAAFFGREPGITALELNMSCPNVSGGLDYSTDPKVARKVIERVRKETDLPLIAKLSPNITDPRPVAEAVVKGGATGISAINTLLAIAIDWRKQKPVLGRGFGGLSGPCIKPVALRLVHQIAQAVDVPITGIGGIQDADDAMEFLVAGASAIQVGTANYYRPAASIEILEGLPERIAALGATSVSEVIGSLRMPTVD